ncbi:unnamed protein product [Protopolystoma xenopodis]|uniref:Uncharacterized protein n=1 Tax=Protopolystoma xenopodis TaxID=117903 RepID=A0A448X065_9PLAT|nr:unnamed protein product [Protopolystoma xenopodis]
MGPPFRLLPVTARCRSFPPSVNGSSGSIGRDSHARTCPASSETARTLQEKRIAMNRSHRDLNSDRWIQSPEC